MKNVVIAVDDFDQTHRELILGRLKGLADIHFIPQSMNDDQFISEIRDVSVFVGWPKPELLKSTSIKLLQIGSSGWDRYENQNLRQQGIRLCNARGVYSVGVAECGIALMFALTRRFNDHFTDMTQGKFQRHEPYGEIEGSTACVVGVGEIGHTLAEKCKGLGMRVIGVGNAHQYDQMVFDNWYNRKSLADAVMDSDHLFITVSGKAENHHLINSEILDQMKTSACIYNLSRGTVIDQKTLIELLKQGKIKGAGLDVTDPEPPRADSELYKLPNVVLSGHSGGLSAGWKQRFIDLIVNNITNYFSGEPLINEIVDY